LSVGDERRPQTSHEARLLRDAWFALLGEGQPDEPGDDDGVPA
jgi:hypothetical protein